MKILDRLPIAADQALLGPHGEKVKVRPFQIAVHVSLTAAPVWNPSTPRFLALLDTGNNHNLAIQAQQIVRWAGIHPDSLSYMGLVREGGKALPLRSASLWAHRNRPGRRELRESEPFLLPLEEGIIVYPDDGFSYPRLPLLGLRPIITNQLRLVINGPRRCVSLYRPLW